MEQDFTQKIIYVMPLTKKNIYKRKNSKQKKNRYNYDVSSSYSRERTPKLIVEMLY